MSCPQYPLELNKSRYTEEIVHMNDDCDPTSRMTEDGRVRLACGETQTRHLFTPIHASGLHEV